jgi:hypothetical protein
MRPVEILLLEMRTVEIINETSRDTTTRDENSRDYK